MNNSNMPAENHKKVIGFSKGFDVGDAAAGTKPKVAKLAVFVTYPKHTILTPRQKTGAIW